MRGDGRLGEEIRTDATGETKLYVENVTASLPRQQLKVTIADAAFRPLAKGVFREMVGEVLASAPQTIIDINVVKEKQESLSAYQCGRRSCDCAGGEGFVGAQPLYCGGQSGAGRAGNRRFSGEP